MINNGLKGIDTSFYDGGASPDGSPAKNTLDWAEYANQGWYWAFIKLSQADFIDPLFTLQWEAARGKIYRGGYHFFKPSVPVTSQTQILINHYRRDPGEFPPILDLETTDGVPGRTVAIQALDWLGYVEDGLGVKPIVYSSTYFLRDIIYAGEFPEFSSYELWLAQYYYDNMSDPARAEKISRVLNNVDSLIFPNAPAPWSQVDWFQWTAKGKAEDVPGYYLGYGHKKSVDFNYSIHKTLESLKTHYSLPDLPDLPDPPDPPPVDPEDTATQPYDGVTYIQGVRPGGSRDVAFHLLLVDMSKVKRSHATNTGGILRRTTDAVKSMGAQIGQNGHGWDHRVPAPHLPYGTNYSDGNLVSNDKDFTPFLNITQDQKLSMPYKDYSQCYNSLGSFRYLIENGNIKDYLYGDDVQYTERHARSCRGITADGRLMVLVADGTFTMEYGLMLRDCAELMSEYGAVVASDNDSGGSATLVIDGEMVNTPSDPEERYVANHLLLWFDKKETPPMTNGNIKGTQKAGSSTNIKSMSGGSGAVTVLQPGEYVYGEWSTGQTDIINFDHFYKSDGTLVMLGEICKCWAGNLSVIVEQEPTDPVDPPDPPDPPPTDPDYPLTINGVEEWKDTNGNIVATYDVVKTKR